MVIASRGGKPALLTSTSTGPTSASILATHSAMAAASVTSAEAAIARPPAASISSAIGLGAFGDEVVHRHAGTGGRERACDLGPQVLAGPGDQGDALVQRRLRNLHRWRASRLGATAPTVST